MFFLDHLLHIRVKETNQGVCLIWKCPRCEELRDFFLIVSKGNYSFIGIEFSKSAILLDLKCSICGYEVRVSPSERELLEQATEVTRRFKEGDLTQKALLTTLQSLPARFISDLTALTETWKCPKCGEENPVSFDSCWNCRAKNSRWTNTIA